MHYLFGSYELDTRRFELRVRGAICSVQPKPLDLLGFLLAHRNRVVLKSELLARLWPGVCVTDNALAQAVAAAREAIAEAGANAIACVRGRGYRFTLPAVEQDASRTVPAAPIPLPLTRKVVESLAASEGIFVDAEELSDLRAFLDTAATSGATIVRSSASASASLATFRNLVAKLAEILPDTRIGGAGGMPLAQWVTSVTDDHAFVAGVLALFEEEPLEPSVLVLEHFERADIASVLLFGMLARTRRPGRLLVATSARRGLAGGASRVRLGGGPSAPAQVAAFGGGAAPARAVRFA